jgi:hypothetical protein
VLVPMCNLRTVLSTNTVSNPNRLVQCIRMHIAQATAISTAILLDTTHDSFVTYQSHFDNEQFPMG